MKASDVFSSLVSVWTEWQDTRFLINRRFIRQGSVISWENCTPEILEEPIYSAHVADMFNRGQYSFQIGLDGSLIQIYYVFSKRDELSSANLAFFSAGDDPDIPIGWLRIDFDPSNYRGVLHPKSHMHISLFPNARLIVDGVPSPRQFIEFIAAMCYPDVYQEKHTNKNGQFVDKKRMCAINSPYFHVEDPSLYQYLTHIKIPIESVARM